MKKWTLVVGLVVVLSSFMVVWAQQDGAQFFPSTKGSKWTYESLTKAVVNVGGMEINIVDTKGTTTEEVTGDSEEVKEPKGVMVRRSVQSEKGIVNGQDGQMDVTEATHVGWNGEWLMLYQQKIEGLPGRATIAEKYNPPLRLLKKTLKEGDTWEVGTLRQEKLSMPARAKVAAFEDVTVPAGTFKQCLKLVREVTEPTGQVEGGGFLLDVKKGNMTSTQWYAPGVGLVKEETKVNLTLEAMGMVVEFHQTQNRALQAGYQVAK
ncbi:MAG: hypothetical protein NZT92_17405 [Abditibacteriales bacterium]|nr:hypothetical protein [Abditibacteriales bacterium]MDW8367626.1 hypothetical protein [Abditibacteriales bacterium]